MMSFRHRETDVFQEREYLVENIVAARYDGYEEVVMS